MKIYIVVLACTLLVSCSDNCEKTLEYYPSGELKGLLTVCNGSEIGEFIGYYESGEVNLKANIKNGHLIGEAYRYRKNAKVGVKEIFDSNSKKAISQYYDSNEVLIEINAYKLFDYEVHAKKVFLDKNIIDTVESDFVKLKRIKNKLEIELISKNSTYKDSIKVYFLNDLNDEYYNLPEKNNRSISFPNTRKFTLDLTNDDFVNNRCSIYIQSNKYYECDKNTTYKVCSYTESFYVQFDKDDYDMKDNLTPIY